MEEIRLGFSLFLSNPDVDNLYALYKLQQSRKPDLRGFAGQTRRQAEKVLIGLKRLSPAEQAGLEAKFALRFREENALAESPSPFTRARIPPSREESPRSGVSLFLSALPAFLVIALVLNLLDLASTPSAGRQGKGGAIIFQPAAVEGTVVAVTDGGRGLTLLDSHNVRIQVVSEADRVYSFRQGDLVTGLILPFRLTPEGVVLARAQRIMPRQAQR